MRTPTVEIQLDLEGRTLKADIQAILHIYDKALADKVGGKQSGIDKTSDTKAKQLRIAEYCPDLSEYENSAERVRDANSLGVIH